MLFRSFRGLGDDPELAFWVVNQGHGMPGGGTDGPTASEEVNLVVGVDAASEVERQMEVQEAGVGTGLQDGALFFLGLGAGIVRGKTGGAAEGAILAGQLVGEQFPGGGVSADLLVGQKRDEAVLQGAKAAFDFAFGLGAGGDQMGDPQRGEGALELRARIAPVGRGLVAEQGQAIGVEREGQAVEQKSVPEVLEMVPGGVGGNEAGGQQFA